MFMDEIMGAFCAINTSCKPDFSETTGKKNLLLKQNCSSCIDGVHLKGLMLQLCTTSAILPDLSQSRPLMCHSSEAIGSGLGATKLGVPQPEIREWDCYDCTGKATCRIGVGQSIGVVRAHHLTLWLRRNRSRRHCGPLSLYSFLCLRARWDPFLVSSPLSYQFSPCILFECTFPLATKTARAVEEMALTSRRLHISLDGIALIILVQSSKFCVFSKILGRPTRQYRLLCWMNKKYHKCCKGRGGEAKGELLIFNIKNINIIFNILHLLI